MSQYNSVIIQLLQKARLEGSTRLEWSLLHDILLAFRQAMELHPDRSTNWFEYESEKQVWTQWFGVNDKFPGIEPPYGSINTPLKQRKPLSLANPFYLKRGDGDRKILLSRQTGDAKHIADKYPSIETVLSGPQFGLNGGGINFEALSEAALISARDADDFKHWLASETTNGWLTNENVNAGCGE